MGPIHSSRFRIASERFREFSNCFQNISGHQSDRGREGTHLSIIFANWPEGQIRADNEIQDNNVEYFYDARIVQMHRDGAVQRERRRCLHSSKLFWKNIRRAGHSLRRLDNTGWIEKLQTWQFVSRRQRRRRRRRPRRYGSWIERKYGRRSRSWK